MQNEAKNVEFFIFFKKRLRKDFLLDVSVDVIDIIVIIEVVVVVFVVVVSAGKLAILSLFLANFGAS